MSRLPKEKCAIREGEQHHIARLCKDKVQFQAVVEYLRLGASSKPEWRILGLGKYRFFFLKRGTNGKLMREHHLLDLEEVKYNETTAKVILRFRSPNPKDASTSIELGSDGFIPLSHMIHAIRVAYQIITQGFPEEYAFKLDVPQNQLFNLDPPSAYHRSGGGIIETYKAWCDYYNKTNSEQASEKKVGVEGDLTASSSGLLLYSAEVVHHLEDLIRSDTRDLDISQFPGIELSSDLTFDLLPLFNSLKHNTFFQSLSMKNIERRDLISLTASVIRSNRKIEKLYIENINGGSWDDFVDLGDSLKANAKHSSILYLQFPNNSLFQDKGMLSLSNALQSFPHGIHELNLRNTKLTEAGITQLIYALEKNYMHSLSLRLLDLSYNRFDESASQSLTNWLLTMKENSALKILRVAYTNINLLPLSRAARMLNQLVEWDISGNKINEGSCQLICTMAEITSSLEILNVSECDLNSSFANQIVVSLFTNNNLKNVHLIMSNNKYILREKSATPLPTPTLGLTGLRLLRVKNVKSIDLSHNSFKEKEFLALLLSLISLSSLETLILDNSFRNKENGDKVASALSSLVWANGSIQTLSLKGSYQTVISAFLSGLGKNSSLKQLNISNNKIGDRGASMIAECLRVNKGLEKLSCDGNHISLSGWQAIASSFAVNATLESLEWPWTDFEKCSSSLSAPRRELLRNVLEKIQAFTRENLRRKHAAQEALSYEKTFGNISGATAMPVITSSASSPSMEAITTTYLQTLTPPSSLANVNNHNENDVESDEDEDGNDGDSSSSSSSPSPQRATPSENGAPYLPPPIGQVPSSSSQQDIPPQFTYVVAAATTPAAASLPLQEPQPSRFVIGEPSVQHGSATQSVATPPTTPQPQEALPMSPPIQHQSPLQPQPLYSQSVPQPFQSQPLQPQPLHVQSPHSYPAMHSSTPLQPQATWQFIAPQTQLSQGQPLGAEFGFGDDDFSSFDISALPKTTGSSTLAPTTFSSLHKSASPSFEFL